MTDRTRRPADSAALDDAARITPDDVTRARAVWRRAIPGPLKQLLDATVDTSMPPTDDAGT